MKNENQSGHTAEMNLSKEECLVLGWLSKDDGQYGECSGKALDRLMQLGLAEWKRRDMRGDDYGYVGLTEAGFAEMKKT